MTEPSHMGAIHDGRAAYSPKQFEKAFGIGHTKLYELIGSGQLVARKIGKRTIRMESRSAHRCVREHGACAAQPAALRREIRH